MIVMKFGGTSVGTGDRINNVAAIVKREIQIEPVVVVVSAMSQVTNLLARMAANTLTETHAQLTTDLKQLHKIHIDAARALGLQKAAEAKLLHTIDLKISHLESIVHSLHALGELTARGHDLTLSFGERLSVQLVASALENAGVPARPLEASELIVTNDKFGNAQPLLVASRKRLKAKLEGLLEEGITPVITGYMAGTADKVITTLGRGGSDYSATILGHCLDAREVWIWTDVDGVMTADPRVVRGAANISELTYDEAGELSFFGAKVLHPRTMIPASLKNTPIWIRNTLDPAARGTKISTTAAKTSSGIKAITVMKGLSLITVQGKGLSGVPGGAAKVFTAIAAEGINVLFISVASSENNLTFLIKSEEGDKAIRCLKQLFRSALTIKSLEMVQKEEGLAMLAVVGEGMKNHPGIAGKIFSALGDDGINVRAIAQGSSELNISFVVEADSADQSMQGIHDRLHLAQKTSG